MQSDFEQIENLRQLAQKAYDEDRMATVVELLKFYLEHFSGDSKAWFNYGEALRVLGQKGAAAVALGKAEKVCPPEYAWTVQCRLASLYADKGDHSAAERWFARALEAEEAQQMSWMWVLRGGNFAEQGLFDEAETFYRKAIAVNDKDDEAYLNLAMVCRAKGEYEAATIAAKTALMLCPDYPDAEEVLESLVGAEASREMVKRLRGQE